MENETIRDYDHFIDKDGLVFNVKGYDHPRGKLRASLIYIPVPFKTGKRHKKTGVSYARVIDDIGNAFVARNYKKLLYQDPITLNSFIAVPRSRISMYYSVLKERGRVLKRFESGHPVFLVLKKLEKIGIEKKDLGFFGTALANIYNGQTGYLISDVDIVIYGRENYQKWLKSYEEKFAKYLVLPGMSPNRYKDFALNFPFSFEEALRNFGKRRCPYKLFIDGVKFDIRFAYYPEEAPKIEKSEPVEEIKIRGAMKDSSESWACPAIYWVKTKKGNFKVITYRHHFRHLFNRGEKIEVFGMLNKDGTITLERHDFYIREV